MAELNPRQLRFVQLYVRLGNATKAAIEAGYSEKTARQQGSRLLSHADIAKAIAAAKADIDALLADHVVDSIRVMAEIMNDVGVAPEVRLKATELVLNRALGKPTERIEQKGNVQVTWSQLVNEARPYLRAVKGSRD